MSDNETVSVSVSVKNTGMTAGKEAIQLYARDVDSSVIRPQKELKGFEKVELQPGEEKTVTFPLTKRAFAFYDTDMKDWRVESGDFVVLAGDSSRNIALRTAVRVNSTIPVRKVFTPNTPVGEIMADPAAAEILKSLLQSATGTKPSVGEPDNNTGNAAKPWR